MNLNLTTATRYGLNVLAAFGASMALYFGKSIFIPLTIAGLLAAMLWPWARWMHRRIRLPWFVACSAAIGLLVLVVLLVAALVALSVPLILNDLPNPNNPEDIQNKYTKLREKFVPASRPAAVRAAEPSDPAAPDREKPADPAGAKGGDKRSAADPPPPPPGWLNELLPEKVGDAKLYQELLKYLRGEQVTKDLVALGGGGMHILAETTLVLFTLLFLLVEGQMLVDKVRNIFGPGPAIQGGVSRAFREMAESVRSYLVWRTIVNIGLGVVLGAVYYSIGLQQYAVLWGLLTVILCYIPYLGTIAAGVLPTLDALVNLGPLAGLGVLVFYIVVVTVEGYIIVPWVMGRSMDLNATTVLVACLFWYLVWGTAGLFLAMPMMAAIKAICANVPGWAAWGELMGSEHTPPPPHDESKPIIDLSAVTAANGEMPRPQATPTDANKG